MDSLCLRNQMREEYLSEVIGKEQEQNLAGWIDNINQNAGYESEELQGSFDKCTLPAETKEYTAVVEKPKHKVDDGKKITWINKRPPSNENEQTGNIPTTGGVVGGEAKEADTPLKAWALFVSNNIIDTIVLNTNEKIRQRLGQLELNEEEMSKGSHIRLIDSVEMKSFFGLLYARGLLGLNTHDYHILFHESFGHPIFGAVMSAKRFAFIHANISFDDLKTRHRRWVHDRFAAARDVFECFNRNCSSVVQPDDFLTIDETLYGCRTQIGFRQYNRSKPVRYGLLYKSINAVRYPFTFSTVVYSGKPIEGSGPFYVTGTLATVKALINQLKSSIDLRGRTISLDRLYTSIELFEWLLSQSINALGTIDAGRKGIPLEIKNIAGKQDKLYEVYWEKKEGKLCLNSFINHTKSKALPKERFIA
ncbi:piggyBac transposable element-derived protein 4-like [Macrobrachium rosenbergii]|uniref:piggyBac transposable element-derived protein 4-like n=1 Tax=Macrobrachium rosenbergii TaxID=79674 RepID=UPI0034D49F27